MQFNKIIASALMAFSFLASPAMAEKVSINMDEVKYALGMQRNMGGYIRLSGVLTDILRVMKTEFTKKPSAADNAAAQQAEDLLNEAGLAASQDDFDESFAIMEKASGVILGAIDRFNAQN